MDDDGSEAGRHAESDAKELEEELPRVEGEPDHNEGDPAHARTRQPQRGYGGHEEAERGEKWRRDDVEGHPRRHEREPPHHRHCEREEHVAGRHAARPYHRGAHDGQDSARRLDSAKSFTRDTGGDSSWLSPVSRSTTSSTCSPWIGSAGSFATPLSSSRTGRSAAWARRPSSRA